jgi:hypothetical protein
MRHRSVAKELCRAAADGIRFGTIGYADFAGGVEQGLLLWYAGITTKDHNATEHALDLSRLANKARIAQCRHAGAIRARTAKPFEGVLKGELKIDKRAGDQRACQDRLCS